jgi:hypothetical protein
MSVEISSIDSLSSGASGASGVVDSFEPITSSSSESMDSKNKITLDESVNEKIAEYYKLKQSYDKKKQDQKNSILANDKLTLKQKQDKYRKLTINCINCGRKVGTIFKNSENLLTAICGDNTKPCILNIKIDRGAYINLEDLMDVFQSGVNDLKEQIITIKLDLLFGYEKESKVLEKFNILKDELAGDLESVMEYKTQYIEKMYNLDNKTDLDAKMRTFYNNVSMVKSTIDEFNETGQIQLIKDMIVLYDKEMVPLLDDIRNLKYKDIHMEYNNENLNLNLIRKTFTLQDMLYTMETPKVESFVIG